ncbi:hypothetical protein [Methylocaldum sp. SAD2]|uniref:hypothetical protein n=1 Tax=Methylocaldum sp. GT1BB TaxID=3438963 RepID=UPI00197C159F
MSDLARRICEAMSSLEFVERSYPMLTHWGVRDADVLVHSLGCSVWNALGQEMGFMAVTECPAPMTHGADIRSDSTWFCRQQRSPIALVEFERFDGTERGQLKLDEKLCNLLEASMRWGNSPSVLVLATWNKGVVSAPDKDKLVERCRNGFRSSVGARVPPVRAIAVVFSRFLFEIESNGSMLLKQLRCERLL